jgi:polar amino acid transport system substrate-binding protein
VSGAPLAVVAADLQTIRQRGYLIVAVKDNLPPLGFRNAAGQWQGLEIDLAHRLAEVILGSPDAVKFVPVLNQDRLQLVMEDRVDVAIAQITATPARARLVYFSSPYYLNGTSFVTSQPELQTMAQLVGQPIAVLQASRTVAVVKSALPESPLLGVDSYQAGKALLDSGQAVAFAANTAVLTGWVQTDSGYHLIPEQLAREPLAVAFPKGLQYQDLAVLIHRAIAQWRQDGWLAQRATYWGLP